MKTVRFGAKGKEKPGLIDKEGKLRDLSGEIADITPEQLYWRRSPGSRSWIP